LGFLLRHFLGYMSKKEIIHSTDSDSSSSEVAALRAENEKLKKDLASCLDSYNSAKKKSAIGEPIKLAAAVSTPASKSKSTTAKKTTPKTKATATKKTASNEKDDLKIIEGIGPALEKLLNENGIFSFAQLANESIAKLDKILDDAGPRFRVHVPETWAEQAALLRDGKMEEFAKLTEKLKGGRRK